MMILIDTNILVFAHNIGSHPPTIRNLQSKIQNRKSKITPTPLSVPLSPHW